MLAAPQTDITQQHETADAADMHYLVPAQLAERWHTSVGHLANLRCAGRGPAYMQFGRRILYPFAGIVEHENAATVVPNAA